MHKELRRCKWLLREVTFVLIPYFGLLSSLWCLSVDSSPNTTIAHGRPFSSSMPGANLCLSFGVFFLVFLSISFK